jgi:hypothetical protein
MDGTTSLTVVIGVGETWLDDDLRLSGQCN